MGKGKKWEKLSQRGLNFEKDEIFILREGFLSGKVSAGKILLGKSQSLFLPGKITVPSSWEQVYIDRHEAPKFSTVFCVGKIYQSLNGWGKFCPNLIKAGKILSLNLGQIFPHRSFTGRGPPLVQRRRFQTKGTHKREVQNILNQNTIDTNID